VHANAPVIARTAHATQAGGVSVGNWVVSSDWSPEAFIFWIKVGAAGLLFHTSAGDRHRARMLATWQCGMSIIGECSREGGSGRFALVLPLLLGEIRNETCRQVF
jgi:hypothetical protein